METGEKSLVNKGDGETTQETWDLLRLPRLSTE
jgi:hypothetical protein